MKQLVTTLTTAFPDSRFTVEDIIAAGDKVVGRGTWSGTHHGEFLGIPATDKAFRVSQIQIYRFAGGKAVALFEAADLEEARKAVGSLPMVKAGFIAAELIPLAPYVGFERLFAK